VGGELRHRRSARARSGHGALRRTVALAAGSGPEGVAADGEALWVANNRGASVSRVDADSGEVRATVKAGVGPRGIAVGAGTAWVANTVSGNVAAVSPP
jgi:YVTN family beta-propeller protein